MKTALVLVLLSGLVAAACPSYAYHDFVWASGYATPARPPDSLVDNCQNLNLSTPGTCAAIQNANLTLDEKKRVILDNLVTGTTAPLNEAASWNGAATFGKYPPDGVTAQNSVNIRNAWVKIASINPTIANATGQVFSNTTGFLKTASGFSFVVPQNTFSTDCKTIYNVCGYNYDVQATSNDLNLNQSGASRFDFSNANQTQNTFTAALSVNSEYQIDHYHWVRRCSKRSCSQVCLFFKTDVNHDFLITNDTSTTLDEPFNATGRVFIDAFQNGVADAWLVVNATQTPARITLKLENASLVFPFKVYQFNATLSPYNPIEVLVLNATTSARMSGVSALSQEINQTPFSLKVHFLAPAENFTCALEILSDFENQTLPNACDYNETQQPVLNLTLVQLNGTFIATLRFYDNATNGVFVGKTITFNYANQTAQIQTDAQGQANATFTLNPHTNLVVAGFDTDFQVKSARAYAVLAAPLPEWVNEWLYWVGLLFGFWLCWKLAKRLIK